MYYLLFTGAALLAVILLAFWLKDRFHSPKLARIVNSELVARFALLGAVFVFLGLVLIIAEMVPY